MSIRSNDGVHDVRERDGENYGDKYEECHIKKSCRVRKNGAVHSSVDDYNNNYEAIFCGYGNKVETLAYSQMVNFETPRIMIKVGDIFYDNFVLITKLRLLTVLESFDFNIKRSRKALPDVKCSPAFMEALCNSYFKFIFRIHRSKI